MKLNSLAKLVIVQSLADHDGAAIFGFEIVNFNKLTGVSINRVRVYPSLHEQEAMERAVDMHTLGKVLQGNTAQQYLLRERSGETPPHGLDALLESEIFKLPDPDLEVFWWQSWKAYPVLRSLYLQMSSSEDAGWEMDRPVLDARSFVGRSCVERLDDNSGVFELVNQISQKYMFPAGTEELTEEERT